MLVVDCPVVTGWTDTCNALVVDAELSTGIDRPDVRSGPPKVTMYAPDVVPGTLATVTLVPSAALACKSVCTVAAVAVGAIAALATPLYESVKVPVVPVTS